MTNFPFLSVLKIRKTIRCAYQHKDVVIQMSMKSPVINILPASAVKLLTCHVLMKGAYTSAQNQELVHKFHGLEQQPDQKHNRQNYKEKKRTKKILKKRT